MDTKKNQQSVLFTCGYCGKIFKHKKDLKIHLLKHTGERPHSCTFCDKSFTTISSLDTHFRTHTGARPYACELCPKAFADNSNRIRHQNTHKPDSHVACGICSKKYSRTSRLKIHMSKHMQEDIDAASNDVMDAPSSLLDARIDDNKPPPLSFYETSTTDNGIVEEIDEKKKA